MKFVIELVFVQIPCSLGVDVGGSSLSWQAGDICDEFLVKRFKSLGAAGRTSSRFEGRPM